MPTDRLFFAIRPDGDAAARTAKLARDERHANALRGKPLATDKLHVTLHYLGDYPGLPLDIVAAASDTAAAIAFPPFEIALDCVMAFGRSGRRPIVVGTRGGGAAGLKAFRQVLAVALADAGLALPDKRPFVPHMTLLYGDRSVDEHPVAPIEWIAHEFLLVRSLINQQDRRHEALGRWRLRR